MLSAIILSAGESKRMGGNPKALLSTGEEPSGKKFIELILTRLNEISIKDIIIVVGAHNQEITSNANLKGAKIIYNENWQEGQLSSLRKGISSLDTKSEGFMLNPVDCPFVRKETYEKLISEWHKDKTKIIIPSYEGRNGHPSIFPSWTYDILLNENLPEGAKTLLKQNPDKTLRIIINDRAITDDIDTTDDYKKLLTRNNLNNED